MKKRALFLSLILFVNFVSADTVEQTIPITMNNIKGHQILFDEGYYVITSSRQALDYAYEKSVMSSKQIWQHISKTRELRQNRSEKNKSENLKARADNAVKIKKGIKETGDKILQSTDFLVSQLDEKSGASRHNAFETLTLGYIEFSKRNEKDFQEMKEVRASWFSDIKNDIQNFGQLYKKISETEQSESSSFFRETFQNAQESVQREYMSSGNRSNSLLALLDLSWGYAKGLYYSVFKPVGIGTLNTTLFTYNVISKSVTTTTKVFFYSSSVGYKVVAPTLESGYLGSLSIIQWTGARATNILGKGFYAINQVAVVGSDPIYKGGSWMLSTVADTAENSVLAVYDYGKGAGQVALNQVKAGVVLGANAITALPAQTILLAANSTVFLVYDGPRLAIYAARGKFNGVDINELPAGVVIDAEQLKTQNVQLEKLSDKTEDIEKVIYESSKDHVK